MKPPTNSKAPIPWVGRRMNRLDGPLKVRGQATFVADFDLPGLVHAVLVGAGVAHGRVLSIGAEAARALPGVLEVLTHQSAGVELHPVKSFPSGPAGTRVLPLQNADIEQRGQPVAVVIAQTLEQAQHAALLLDVEYEHRNVTATLQDGLDSLPLIGRLPAHPLAHHRGHPEKELAQPGGVRLEATYVTPQHTHNPMELHSTTAVWQDDTHLSVYEPSQWMQAPQQALATLLGLKPDDVHVICPYIGGGFGSKATPWMHVALAALAARVVQRPVKLALTRAQMFSGVGYRPATIQRFQVGAQQDGRLSAAVLHADTQVGMSDLFPEQVGTVPRMLYRLDHLNFTQQLVKTHAGGGIMMRAPGEASGSFGLEVMMDELAHLLHLDPLELRLRNYAETDPESGKPYSSKHLRECYLQAAQRFGWERRTPEPGSMKDGETLIGWGMATAAYPVYGSPGTARVRIEQSGTVTLEAGTHELGTGTYSILAQIAADALGVDAPDIVVKLGDSDLPKNAYSGGSRTAGSVGSAVLAAAGGLKAELIELAVNDPASVLYGAAPAEIVADQGVLRVQGDPARQESYAALLRRSGQEHLACYRETIPNEGSRKELEKMLSGQDGSVEAVSERYARYSFGAVFVEVRLDPDFLTPKVSRMVGVFDVGRVLNHKTAESQLIGGMIWGLSMALREETQTDPATGLVLNANFADYHIPVNADVGSVEVSLLDVPDYHVSAVGARGAGEIGIVGTAAAIANAIYHATGKRVRDLPITLDKLL